MPKGHWKVCTETCRSTSQKSPWQSGFKKLGRSPKISEAAVPSRRAKRRFPWSHGATVLNQHTISVERDKLHLKSASARWSFTSSSRCWSFKSATEVSPITIIQFDNIGDHDVKRYCNRSTERHQHETSGSHFEDVEGKMKQYIYILYTSITSTSDLVTFSNYNCNYRILL